MVPLDLRPLFVLERAALREVLTGLTAAEWALPTVCPGWDVHDVVAHVLHDHIRRISGTRDGHGGAVFENGETLPAFLNRVNGEFVQAQRAASPRMLIDLLTFLGPQLDDVWAGLDLAAPAPLDVYWAQVDDTPSPVWLDIAREYTEFWVHQQQVRDAVGRPGGDSPALLGPVVSTFVFALPVALHGIDRPVGTVVELVVPGEAGGRWTVVRANGRWEFGSGGTAAATVVLAADDLWRLGSRGISPSEAHSRASISGDPELGAAVTSLLAVIA
jgi:uncharacterized protein (TIGR03083 family)